MLAKSTSCAVFAGRWKSMIEVLLKSHGAKGNTASALTGLQ